MTPPRRSERFRIGPSTGRALLDSHGPTPVQWRPTAASFQLPDFGEAAPQALARALLHLLTHGSGQSASLQGIVPATPADALQGILGRSSPSEALQGIHDELAAQLTRLADAIPDLPAVSVPPVGASIADLNKQLIARFKAFLNSEEGHQLARQLQQELDSGTLVIPVLVVEEVLRTWLQSFLRRNAVKIFLFAGWRVSAATALLHAAKLGLARLAAKRPRARRVVAFASDVLLPTVVFGPLAGACWALSRVNVLNSKSER